MQDCNLELCDDLVIWKYAAENNFVLITKDKDFVSVPNPYSKGPIIVWLRKPNTSRRVLLQWFEGIFPQIIQEVEKGLRVIEVR